jgi:hyperosmotically inducible periplasmic protein
MCSTQAAAYIGQHGPVNGLGVHGLIQPLSCFPFPNRRSSHMNKQTLISITLAISALVATAGCAVTRGQESVGAYIDDTAITTAVKARFVDNKTVDATAISVETMKGTVMLSGFAKSMAEKSVAESLAWKVEGVKAVKNELAVRP